MRHDRDPSGGHASRSDDVKIPHLIEGSIAVGIDGQELFRIGVVVFDPQLLRTPDSEGKRLVTPRRRREVVMEGEGDELTVTEVSL